MDLSVTYVKPACADGVYRIKAKGCVLGILFWGCEAGILPDWTAIAYVPLIDGKGCFRFIGGRAVPPEATRVYARLVADDGTPGGELFVPIPPEQKAELEQPVVRFVSMSDLHLTAKTWKLTSILFAAKDADALLLTSDLVNDGQSEQLLRFDACLRETVSIPVFPNCGNHDLPLQPEKTPGFSYDGLEDAVLKRAEGFGVTMQRPLPGFYVAEFGFTEIIGVACVTDTRKFKFPAGVMDALEAHLAQPSARRRILLCHAPLLAHNPKRHEKQPYLNLDHRLQKLIDGQRDLIFLSGHLHHSPNGATGNVEYDFERNNVYISNGSACPNTAKWTDAIIPEGWTSGVYTRLSLSEKQTEVQFITLSGKKLARGYYLF